MSDLPVPVVDDEPDVTVDDSPSLEDRVAWLEYNMARVPHLLPRAPVTNPVDDPDDPPMIPDENDPTNPHKFSHGSWEGHEWHGIATKGR